MLIYYLKKLKNKNNVCRNISNIPIKMEEYYFISDYYMGEEFNDTDYPINFINGFNGIKLKGTILEEKFKKMKFRIDKVINFVNINYSENIPKTGDIIEIEWEKKYSNGEYYTISLTPFDTNISIVMSNLYYEKRSTEEKFSDLTKTLGELEINGDYEKKYLTELLENFIKKINLK